MTAKLLPPLASTSTEQIRFSPQRTECYAIDVLSDGTHHSRHELDSSDNLSSSDHLSSDLFTHRPSMQSQLFCVLQRQRPLHISAQPDPLPFPSSIDAKALFERLSLPTSYFDISDGLLSTAHSFTTHGPQNQVARFELIAHCVNKQGDWALAISHNALTRITSVFWSVDQRIQSPRLTDDLLANPKLSVHPMLIPCIMLETSLLLGLERRRTVKQRMQVLEEALHGSVTVGQQHDSQTSEGLNDFDNLFALLQSCRTFQRSRRGRVEFWHTFYQAIKDGLQYFKHLPSNGGDGGALCLQVHDELERRVGLTWRRLESLMARDQDHIDRIESLSQTLHNLIQQRDIRLQSDIARAAQRDSEDMKYIAVLGSIFLPASLVATILNVPEFQFLDGANLFGAYMGITIPFIGFVVFLCLSRPLWLRKSAKAHMKSLA